VLHGALRAIVARGCAGRTVYLASGERRVRGAGRLTMEWFSLWLPLVSQLVVPVSLLAWLAFGRHATKARSIAVAALVGTYVLAIGIAGLWLVVPWWLPFGYGAVGVWAIARRLRGGDHRPQRPRAVWGLVVTVLIGALAVLLMGIVGVALAGRRPPDDPVDLTFPLGSGTYLVVNGGSQAVRLPKECRFPAQREVLVRREGRRVILEPADEWSDAFRASLGAWSGRIPRPAQQRLRDVRNPFA
jgi:antitoxin VapB